MEFEVAFYLKILSGISNFRWWSCRIVISHLLAIASYHSLGRMKFANGAEYNHQSLIMCQNSKLMHVSAFCYVVLAYGWLINKDKENLY